MDHPIEKPGSVETVALWEPFSIRAREEGEEALLDHSQPDCFSVFRDDEVHSKWVDFVALHRSLAGALAWLDSLVGDPVELEYDHEERYWLRKDSPDTDPDPPGGWRLASTDPPELGVQVLVCVDSVLMTTARPFHDGWFEVPSGARIVPTHWQPLPAPPVTEGPEGGSDGE